LDSNILIQPFLDLSRDKRILQKNYYTSIFEEYEYYLIKDEKLDLNWLNLFSNQYHIRDEPILEIGSGEGRILRYLNKLNLNVEGIEISQKSIERFNSTTSNPSRLKVHNGDIMTYNFKSVYGSILIPNLTINLFNNRNLIYILFKKINQLLMNDGFFALTVFSSDAIKSMKKYKGQTFCIPFIDENKMKRLMWTGLKFNIQDDTLIQNWFVESKEKENIGYLAADKQKLWNKNEINELAERAGFTLKDNIKTQIEGGGADGFKINNLIFKKERTMANNGYK
jgi:SAM-dependent methyltransferase